MPNTSSDRNSSTRFALIESRFGPGAHYDPIVELNDRFYFCSEPDAIPDEYFDLTWRWPMPSAAARPLVLQTTGDRTIGAGQDLTNVRVSLSPLTLARGSPGPGRKYL